MKPFQHFLWEDALCPDCRKEFAGHKHTGKQHGVCYTALYPYDETFKGYLYALKECYDVRIAPVFLFPYIRWFKQMKKRFEFVYPCSSETIFLERRFDPCALILGSIGIETRPLFKREGHMIQKRLTLNQRHKNAQTIQLVNSPNKERVIMFDDVMTSGETIQRCIQLLRPHVKEIRVIVLAKPVFKTK